jgi:DNA-binding Lrp family transcriptional regulator
VLNLSDEEAGMVSAVIEVRITPERGGGFNRLAERISRFDEVEVVLSHVGRVRSAGVRQRPEPSKAWRRSSRRKLSTIEGVLSTATHFMLRSYKEHGFHDESEGKVTP